MPSIRQGLVEAAVNGRIHAIGGESDGDVLGTVERYDPSIDQWATIALASGDRTDVNPCASDSGGRSRILVGSDVAHPLHLAPRDLRCSHLDSVRHVRGGLADDEQGKAHGLHRLLVARELGL